MDLKKIPKEYRPIPFWSWNEKLNADETKRQVDIMDKVGIGGFFMHARGGLQTEYMGSEWFENITAAKNEAQKRDMQPWVYDENGWPSGFGNGIVNGLGVEYQQKYLRMEAEYVHKDTAIAKSGEHWFYYEVNPFYVDTLDKKVTEKFIEVAYKPYYERYGDSFEGFFTDEPQISRAGIPWSFIFEDEYKKRYDEDLISHLEELFININDYKKTRVNFWKMVTDLFSENFMKPIYEQCSKWGVKLTGHLVLEETLLSQLVCNGACMPHYEYFHIPGMDWLGRKIYNCLIALQVSSVAEQLGKDRVLSETYAMCGHNVSFSELKGIYEWQMVRGINLLCPHLQGYSLRGIRKRDYPPAMYYQQSWWGEYDRFVDAMSREGMILAKSKKDVDILVLHPQTTAWALYGETCKDNVNELDEKFIDLISQLEEKHVQFHLGDETIMERHGKVEDGKLVIGNCKYSYIINSCCEILLPKTEELIKEFLDAGGKIINPDELLKDNAVDCKDITYTRRIADGQTIHYFVNSADETKCARINVSGKKLDIYSGELVEFSEDYEFEPYGSLMILDDGEDKKISRVNENLLKLEGEFEVDGDVLNSLLLDRCDYYFDGVLQEKDGYVLNVCERANKLKKRISIHQDYHVNVFYIPEKMYLVCETPEKFRISVNGKAVRYEETDDYFVDKSFKKLEISKYLLLGENIISFECEFEQSEKFYENLKKSYIFESEKNKLTYDFEIEAVYLVGDFSVNCEGEWEDLPLNAKRFHGRFEIDKPKEKITLIDIEMQGFPFFAGELTLKGKINIIGDNPVLDIDFTGTNAIKIQINEIEKVVLTDRKISLKEFGVTGVTNVKITLINNLRNLMGPHHLAMGECFGVGPGQFYKEKCVWDSRLREDEWNDGYCFMSFGKNEEVK